MATEYWRGTETVITRQVEATYGAHAIGSPSIQVYCTQMDFQHGGRIDVAPPTLGLGVESAAAKNARWCDANMTLIPWMYNIYDWLFLGIMRNTALPSATDYTDIFTIDPVGTHIDGSTGPTIVLGVGAAAADLANWNTYNGATSNGAAGFMIESSGWADASNNVPMAIKAVNASQIDIDTPYSTTGATAGAMGALKIAETNVAAVTLKIGQGIRVKGADSAETYSFEADSQTATVPYLGAAGMMLNSLPFAISGNGYATLGPAAFVGQDYSADAAATRYNGTITTNANIETPPFSGSTLLSYCQVNGANKFAGESLTNVGFTLTQNAARPPDIGGTLISPIVKAGVFQVGSGTLDYTSDPGTLDAALITLDRATGAAAEFPLDIKLSNGTSYIWLRCPRCVLNMGARTITDGFVTGSCEIKPFAFDQDVGPFTFQSFAS